MTPHTRLFQIVLFFLLSIVSLPNTLAAGDRVLVWADEFEDASVDQSVWSFEVGPSYETVHYFTDRPHNARIESGVLKIMAQEEEYEGFEYTSALLKSQHALYFQYGRIEARMKMPDTDALVPAFWMLPENMRYGWWPWSGEIDIMEYPTNQDEIYGTCHTFEYSYYTGSGLPSGGNVTVNDASTAFHVYSIEWTPDKIDFYVDDQKYYTYNNPNTGFEEWPFDQPFYLILSMGIGGNWVGNPDASTTFPGVFEIDYVRVYQYAEDMQLYGPDYLLPNTNGSRYFSLDESGTGYDWRVPNQAQINTGQQTQEVEVDWGLFGGPVTLDDGNRVRSINVEVDNNLVKNGDFETGAKYWTTSSFPAEADFIWTSTDVQSGEYAIFIDVTTAGNNIWDVQLGQDNITLKAGEEYIASFWGKVSGGSGLVSANVIHAENYTVYGTTQLNLDANWTRYEFAFTAPANVEVLYNISMGDHVGSCYIDDVQLRPTETLAVNQAENASFKEDAASWVLNTYSPAEASVVFEEGEAYVEIANPGINPWDIHFGQKSFTFEQGKNYVISFDAYASEERDISVIAGLNSEPWTSYCGEQIFQLQQKRTSYDFSFLMQQPTDPAARLGFDIGGALGNVVIDNVFVSYGDVVQSTPEAAYADIDKNLRIFPNPAVNETKISYRVQKGQHVKLDIYTGMGRLIETLENNYLSPGEYQFIWNTKGFSRGIYYVVFTAEDTLLTQKLVLQ